ncbi:MAG: DNA modification methylase [Methanomassiliicoccales archaeon]|jgi:tRNA (guanine10-N2)-dimethyltransferase
MSLRRYLFELSGEHPTLPGAEVVACLEAERVEHDIVTEGPGYLVAKLAPSSLDAVTDRLALTHRVGSYLGSTSSESLNPFLQSLSLPEGTISVRAKRFGTAASPEQSKEASRTAANLLARGRKVDLTAADVKVRILLSDRIHFYLEKAVIDRAKYDERHVRSRPFFSPISLHPRYARALVNLTRVREGQSLLDPFCGTGGILIEAALIGARSLGSDLSQEMLDGCALNMRHFGTAPERLERVDIGEILDTFGRVDAVATDPPYGRSASTMKEPMRELHLRAIQSIRGALRPDGSAAIVLPWECDQSFHVIEHHEQRVHRSLTRHYCVLK